MGLDEIKELLVFLKENFKDGGVRVKVGETEIEISQREQEKEATPEIEKRISESKDFSFDKLFGAKEEFYPNGKPDK